MLERKYLELRNTEKLSFEVDNKCFKSCASKLCQETQLNIECLYMYVITVASDYCAVNNNTHSTLFVRYFRLGTLCNHLQKR